MNRPMAPPVEVGDTELLVYGICETCGWRAALPEGSRWPRCPSCETQVMPVGFDEPEKRLGYVARLETERDAVQKIRALDQGPDGG